MRFIEEQDSSALSKIGGSFRPFGLAPPRRRRRGVSADIFRVGPRWPAPSPADLSLRAAPDQNPGAFSIWSNQSKPISLTMRLEITISLASAASWSLKCWWTVNGGT